MPANGTPDTTSFLYLGLAAIALISIVLLASMAIRYRNLKKDAELLRELESE